jgi:hypothetical protein
VNQYLYNDLYSAANSPILAGDLREVPGDGDLPLVLLQVVEEADLALSHGTRRDLGFVQLLLQDLACLRVVEENVLIHAVILLAWGDEEVEIKARERLAWG